MSLPIKEFIIRRLTVDLGIPESTIRTVVDDTFAKAIKATSTNKSVEIAGWGTFYFSEKKAEKMVEKYKSQIALFSKILETPHLSQRQINNAEAKLVVAKKNLEELLPRINERTT